MKICIVGAGAIGGYLAVKLKYSGHDVSIVARGPHLTAIKEHGLRLTSENDDITVKLNASATVPEEPQDYVFVTVKATGVSALSEGLKKLSKNGAVIIPAMNGLPHWYFYKLGGDWSNVHLMSVDPEKLLEEAIPFHSIIGTVVYPACEIISPGIIQHISGNRFSIGEPSGERTSRVEILSELLRGAGFKAPISTRIRDELWLKLWGNLAFNPISALTGATLKQICENTQTRELAKNMMAEAKQIGEALNVRFPVSIDKRIAGAAAVGEHKTSMLQDLEQGRSMEIDAIVTSVQELGQIVNISTPYIDTIASLVKQRAELSGCYSFKTQETKTLKN